MNESTRQTPHEAALVAEVTQRFGWSSGPIFFGRLPETPEGEFLSYEELLAMVCIDLDQSHPDNADRGGMEDDLCERLDKIALLVSAELRIPLSPRLDFEYAWSQAHGGTRDIWVYTQVGDGVLGKVTVSFGYAGQITAIRGWGVEFEAFE